MVSGVNDRCCEQGWLLKKSVSPKKAEIWMIEINAPYQALAIPRVTREDFVCIEE
jgi:hypothetical protein